MAIYLEQIYNLLSISFIQAFIYIVGSFILAKIADIAFSSLLSRLVNRTSTSLDDQIVSIMHRPIYYSILFMGFMISVNLIELPQIIIFVLVGIFKTIPIIIWSIAVFKIFIQFIKWYGKSNKKDKIIHQRTVPLFENLSRIAIFLGAIYFIFLSWDIDVTGWLASAGIIGVVLGFAAKDTVANLFAGIFIMADAPYKEGDYINLDSGERGYVKNIGIRSTRLMTRDDIEITIPNSLIANSKIINESGGPTESERVRITISVAYGSDIDIVRNLLLAIAKKSENIMQKDNPRVRFRSFGDSALIFELLFWIEKPSERGRIVDDISSKIYKKFIEEKIEIPYPQRTIHMKTNKSNDENNI
tara:strand:+ start:2068 stop:3144 length:1077 start_codon:yes stop_codon:yes gene_type:complete